MEKRLKKTMAVLSALVMLITFIPAAFSEDDAEPAQDIPAMSEPSAPAEPAADKPSEEKEQPAPAKAEEKPAAPAETGADQPASPKTEEKPAAPAETGAGQTAPEKTEEEPAEPAHNEAEQPAPANDEEEPEAPAGSEPEQPASADDGEEPAAPAQTEPDAPAADPEEAEPEVTAEEQPAPAAAEDEEQPAPAAEKEKPSASDPAAEDEAVSTPTEEEPEPDAEEENDDPAEAREPVELVADGVLYGKITVGEKFVIDLKTAKTGTVLLTLTLNADRTIRTSINDREVRFSREETEGASKAVYTYEYKPAGKNHCFIALSADADLKFRMKAETGSEENTEDPQIEESAEADDPATEGPADEEPAKEEPAEEEPAEEEPAGEKPAEEEPAEDPDRKMLDSGFVKVMVIRENGTNLYNTREADAEAAGRLDHGEEIWVKAAGGMWGEIRPDEESAPQYINLNNVVLLEGEVGYDIPIRKVRLTSTLEGLTEIEEGTEIIMTAEFSGFAEDEIVDITWQYRSEDDEEGVFRTIEEASGFDYSYRVSAENIHHEWRIILTLKS